jgi:hypothetical protein
VVTGWMGWTLQAPFFFGSADGDRFSSHDLRRTTSEGSAEEEEELVESRVGNSIILFFFLHRLSAVVYTVWTVWNTCDMSIQQGRGYSRLAIVPYSDPHDHREKEVVSNLFRTSDYLK